MPKKATVACPRCHRRLKEVAELWVTDLMDREFSIRRYLCPHCQRWIEYRSRPMPKKVVV
jgi:hypothetical protein